MVTTLNIASTIMIIYITQFNSKSLLIFLFFVKLFFMYKFYFDYVFKNDIYVFMMQSSYRTRIEGEI